uniref:Uncharacterized protein n=1 Tax=Trichogramma kaykai TaxID=54128 RepID=A0ABD2XKP6_9HYME
MARVRALIYRIQPPEPTTALKSREHAEKIAERERERGASSGQGDAFWTRSKKKMRRRFPCIYVTQRQELFSVV